MNEQYREQCVKIKNQVDEKLKSGNTMDLFLLLQENMEIIKYDNDLMTVWYLGKICEKEKEKGKRTVYDKEKSLDTLLDRHLQLKFYLRRIENNILDKKSEFYQFLQEKNVSEYELMGIINSCVYDKGKVQAFFTV